MYSTYIHTYIRRQGSNEMLSYDTFLSILQATIVPLFFFSGVGGAGVRSKSCEDVDEGNERVKKSA